MSRILIASVTAIALSTSAALACTEEDVQERQAPLLEAVQALMAVDPEKAQAIVLKMQTDMDAAAAASDGEAICRIMDEALESAQS